MVIAKTLKLREILRSLVDSSIPELGRELGEGGAGGRGGLQHEAEQQRQHAGNTPCIQRSWSQSLPTGKQQTIHWCPLTQDVDNPSEYLK